MRVRIFFITGFFFLSCTSGIRDGELSAPDADIQVAESEFISCVNATDCEQYPCKAAICKNNECIYENMQDNTPCEDNDPCTVDESCKSGVCIAEKNICEDECKVDADCLSKDDGNLCNGVPWCIEKKCILKLESIVQCEAPSNQCLENKCDPADGICKESKKEDGWPCSDGDDCTKGDACYDGMCEPGFNICECVTDSDCDKHESYCKGTYICSKDVFPHVCMHVEGSEVVCGGIAPVCHENVCDENAKSCVTKKVADFTPCDDNDPCSEASFCVGGKCIPDMNKILCECKENYDCPDDGDLCNGVPYCDKTSFPYKCAGGKPVICDKQFDTECSMNLCDPKTGVCSMTPVNEDMACDDANFCTKDDKCSNGVCKGTPLICEDGKKCTEDTCIPETGCNFTPISPCCGNGKVEYGEDCDPAGGAVEGCDDKCKYKKFLVNKYTINAQRFPKAVYSPSYDTYFIVYQSAWQDGDGDGVFFNYVKPDGTVGTEAMLSKTKDGNQRIPVIASPGSGEVIAVWTDNSTEVRANTIVKSGDSFAVSSAKDVVCSSTGKWIAYTGDFFSPRLLAAAALKNYKRLLLLWSQNDGTYNQPDYNIWACILKIENGTLSIHKNPFMVNSIKAGEQKFLSASGGGKMFLVAWYEEGAGDRVVTIDKDGMLGSELLMSDFFYPHVTGSDTFAVTSGGIGLRYAKFDSEGKKTYGPITLFSDELIILSSSAYTTQTELTAVFSKLKSFTESAVCFSKIKPPYQYFLVDDSQYSQTSPDIAASKEGRFLVVWESYKEDGSSYGIFGKMF